MKDRIEAARNNQKYFEGKPCRTCGSALRYVSTNGCVSCNKKHARNFYHNNKAILDAARQEGQLENR